MRSQATPLSIEMPTAQSLAAEEHVWRILAAHWGQEIRFAYPMRDSGEYRVSTQNDEARWVVIPFRSTIATPHAKTANPGESRRQVLGSDVIAQVLSLLELHEEFQTPNRDQYGLVEGQRSARDTSGQLSKPIVENTAAQIAQALGLPDPPRFLDNKTWALAVSCDIDVLESNHLPSVLDFLANRGVEQPTFFLCATGTEEKTIRDPSYDLANPAIQTLLKPLKASDVEIGLHGSYIAHDRLDLLREQKQRLESWWERSVSGHRAHFYRFAYPRSWAWQYRAGFAYDASLGYPDLPGFRNGCASPTRFFDPEAGAVPFAIFPTGLLDQHFFWPEVWDISHFENYIETLLSHVARVHGVLTIDWHTYTLHSSGHPGWWDRLDYILRRGREEGAFLAGIGTVQDSLSRRWDPAFATEKSDSAEQQIHHEQ